MTLGLNGIALDQIERKISVTQFEKLKTQMPAVSNAANLEDLDGDFDSSRPAPLSRNHQILSYEDVDWAFHLACKGMITSREGATFIRLAPDVFLIAVYGGQFLHDDRHLAYLNGEHGASEHTWNYVVDGDGTQFLICEVARDIFEHFPMVAGEMIYFNTVNRHAVTRKTATDICVIAQICGFNADEQDQAIARLKAVIAARPTPMPV